MKVYFKYLIFILLLLQINILVGQNNKRVVLTKKSKLLKKPRATSSWHKLKLKVGDTLNVISTNNSNYYGISYLGKKGWVNKKKSRIVPQKVLTRKKVEIPNKIYNSKTNGTHLKNISNKQKKSAFDSVDWNIIAIGVITLSFIICLYIFLKKLFLYIQLKIQNAFRKTKKVLDPNNIKINRKMVKENLDKYPFFGFLLTIIQNLFYALFLFTKGILNILITTLASSKDKDDYKLTAFNWVDRGYTMLVKNKIVTISAFFIIVLLLVNNNDSSSSYRNYNNVPTVDVRGYYKSNGTYVKPHQRTKADGIPYNNFGYPGNYNPNKGKITSGSKDNYLFNYYNKDNKDDLRIPNRSGSSQRIGDTYYHSNGESSTKIGDTYFHSDGESSTKIGDTYYNSDGSSSTKIGNTIYHND